MTCALQSQKPDRMRSDDGEKLHNEEKQLHNAEQLLPGKLNK